MEISRSQPLLKATPKVKIGILAASLCLLLLNQTQSAHAATLSDIDPEVIANSWDEQDDHFASVTLNGKEIIRFRDNGNNNSEELVEDIAAKLDELVRDNKFDPEKLLPAREGDMLAMRIDGTTIIKFPVPDVIEPGKTAPASPLEQGLKIVNSIRSSFGAGTLPATFLKLAEASQDVAKGVGHFSGPASWYGGRFNGRKTSDGSKYDQEGLTAAHRSLPFGTKLLVMNRKTGDSCVVKVNDRGPFVDGRVIDLSKGAAKQLNMLGTGIATVDCLVLEQP
jgi:rare lipoprotein A